MIVILDTFEPGVDVGVTVKLGVPELGVELAECCRALLFEDVVVELNIKLAGFEGAMEVVRFGLPLILTLLVLVVAVEFALTDEEEEAAVELNCCVESSDCDLACNVTFSFPSGMAGAVGAGSLKLLRRCWVKSPVQDLL